MLSFSSCNNFSNKKKERGGGAKGVRTAFDFLKHFHDLLVCLLSFSFSNSLSLTSRALFSSMLSPLFSLSPSCSLYLESLNTLSTYCSSPALSLFFTFSFPQGFPRAPCRFAAPVLVRMMTWCGSQAPPPTLGAWALEGGGRGWAEREQRPAGKGLPLQLPVLECSSPSVAHGGGKSGSVHPTDSFSLLYPFFSLHSWQEVGSRYSCPWSRKGCVGRRKSIVPQPDSPL